MAIRKNSSEGVLCVDCNEPADMSGGEVIPLCAKCRKGIMLRKKAMEAMEHDTPRTIRAAAETGALHG